MPQTDAEFTGAKSTFDTIPTLYEARRPPYPEAMAETICAAANLQPGSRLLEIGCGTGKATELFVGRGYLIHALEPGENLAAFAADKFAADSGFTVQTTTFEAWEPEEDAFDLVYAGQSFHWVVPEIGFPKAANVLTTTGRLALFWNSSPPPDEPVFNEIRAVFARVLPEEAVKRNSDGAAEWIADKEKTIREYTCFRDLTVHQFPFSLSYTAQEFVENLSTHSSQLLLAADVQRELYDGITEVIDEHGGSLVQPYITVLFLAEKA